jgi:cysteine desulfurase
VAAGRHYLDHASTAPLRPAALEAMLPWLSEGAADPGRVHTEGRMSRAAIEDARERVAAFFGARPRSVVFTSGATEAINAAVWGACERAPDGALALAGVEHSAVRDASARHRTVTIDVDRLGRIQPGAVAAGTALVHCQWANHEVGTTQPVEQVIAAAHDVDSLAHVDAAAAAGHAPIGFDDSGADLMSISAHKFGGPQGVGALLVRRGLRLAPLLVGGEQERARRGGLENVGAIVGFGAACSAVDLGAEAARNRAQTRRVLEGALAVDGVVAYGDTDDSGRLPNIACLGVDGVEAEAVLLGLDQAGVAAHSGSACSSESLEPSPVLEAMGVDADRSLRVSVGWSTADADIDAFLAAFPAVVARLRALRA